MQNSEQSIQLMLRNQLQGFGVWTDKNDHTSIDGAKRAIRGAGETRPQFVEAIWALLEDSDARVRAGAVELLAEVEIDVARLWTLLRKRPELFKGVAPYGPWTSYPSLDWGLWFAIAQRVTPEATEIVEDIRSIILNYTPGRVTNRLLPSMARINPEWLLKHARERVPLNMIGAIMLSLPAPAYRERFIKCLAPWPRTIVDDFKKNPIFWERVSTDEALRLRRLLDAQPSEKQTLTKFKLLALVSAVLFLFFAFTSISLYVENREITWRPIPGVITATRISEYRYGGAARTRHKAYDHIHDYRYETAGASYTGTDKQSRSLPDPALLKAVGTPVTVYVDPNRPAASTLHPGIERKDVWVAAVFGIATLTSALFMRRYWRRHQRQRYGRTIA